MTGLAVAVAIAAYGWVVQQPEQAYHLWLGRILFLGATRQVSYRKH